MRLHHAPASPFVRKVMILLHEAGRLGEVELVQAAGTPLAPGTLPVSLNPLGKIPALERDAGGTLYDSRVICRFLDDRFGAGLYPSGARLWEVLTLEATADGLMEAALAIRYEYHVRPEGSRSDAWAEAQWAKVARTLDALEARWLSHLAGPFDMGQAAVAAALGYLDFRLADRDWRAGRPGLAAWAARIDSRPSIAATRPAAA